MRIFASIVAALLVTTILGFVGTPAYAQENTNDKDKDDIVYVEKVEVESGDTLTAIAKDHDTTYVRLFNANDNIEHPDIIYPGDTVGVPDEDDKFEPRELPTEPTVAPTPSPAPRAPRPAAAPSPAPNPQPKTPTAAPTGSVWDRLASCESGGNWTINTGNGYYGGLQFSLGSWRAVGGSGYPHQASKAEQINRAQKLQAIQGWGAWPACTLKLGIR